MASQPIEREQTEEDAKNSEAFVSALIDAAHPGMDEAKRQNKIEELASKITWKTRSQEESDLHYKIFDASKSGEYEKFVELTQNATIDDLEWALEVCTDIRILKYLIEDKKIEGFAKYCYRTAVLNESNEIMSYIEEKMELMTNKENRIEYFKVLFASAVDKENEGDNVGKKRILIKLLNLEMTLEEKDAISEDNEESEESEESEENEESEESESGSMSKCFNAFSAAMNKKWIMCIMLFFAVILGIIFKIN